ncbi:MAG TPA: peptidylprolyl isomerase [Sedimentisphaerales bacterium]|jgi:peptidyl-prolyl cis-trans isomerase C|nr:peptidylprolyl isomerase [Sedimentisphaerales bacterium]HNU29209.1 peptidylprolyl isomerase [Sedimentisphaerales bacterium]
MKRVAAGPAGRGAATAGFLTILLAIWGAGCQKKAPQAPNDANAPVAAPNGVTPPQANQASPDANAPVAAPNGAKPPQADKVLATVNGASIMESQVNQRVQDKWKAQLDKLAAQSPEMAAQHQMQAMKMALNEMVIEQLLEEEAKQAGIDVTEEQLIAEITKQLAAEVPPLTLEDYKSRIEAQGVRFETMKGFLMRNMKYSKLLETRLADQIQVTDEEAKAFYDGNPEEFAVPEQVRASHILISTESTDPSADANQVKAQAREKAEKLLAQVKEGADFATVAKENSSCPSATQGGELPPFGRGDMVKPFEEAAFAMKVGEISDLVETQFGYHIIKVAEHSDPNVVAFAAAKDQIVENLQGSKRQKAFTDYIESLRQKAAITYAVSDMAPPRPRAATVQADPNQGKPAPAADPNSKG